MPRKQAFPQTESRRVFGHPFRVGLYARVSTHDQQTLPLQIHAMREYAAKRGWSIVAQIKEVGSGASRRELRTALIAAARRREVDVVLVWRLDRWGRSVADLVSTLQDLQHLGVGFVSLTEALDLTTPAGRAMAGLLAVFAEFEHEIPARARACWYGPRAREGEAPGPAANGGAPRQPGVEAISRRCQQDWDRSPVADRAHLRAPYPECSTMKQRRKDPEREDRIHNQAIVDAYGPEEQAMSWYYYLENKIHFPFHAKCIASKATSPLRKGEMVEVRRLALEDTCTSDMLVLIRWQGPNMAVPLSQLAAIDPDQSTAEAIGDWHYRVEQGYLF
jgi:Calcium binding/Resolvase, N terminal domain